MTHADDVRAKGRAFVYGFALRRVAPDEALERKLAGLGVRLLGAHDDHHKIRVPAGSLRAVAALPEVEWLGVSARDQKLSRELSDVRGSRTKPAAVDATAPIPIVVNLFEGDETGEFGRLLEAAGAALGEYDPDLMAYRAVATGPIVDQIAALDFVLFIELIGLTSTAHDQSTPLINTYFLLACADDQNAVVESDEGNNCIASPTAIVTVARPDLVQTALMTTPPAPATTPGATFSVTDTVENRGLVPAEGSTTRYYLSLDAVTSAGDILLTGSRAVPALAAGATQSGTVTVTIPAATPLNTYLQ